MDPKKSDRDNVTNNKGLFDAREKETGSKESERIQDIIDPSKNLFDSEKLMDISSDEEEIPEGRVIEAVSEDDFALPEIRRVMDQESDNYEEGAVLEDEHIDQNVPLADIRQMEVRRVGTELEDSTDDNKETSGFLYSLLDTLRFICLGLIIGMLLIIFVVQRNTVFGDSMRPTLENKDAVFVEMISVYFNNINRGDVIALDAEGMDGFGGTDKIIKRVIGLPGDTVSIINGDVYINGELLDEPYLSEGLKTNVPVDGINNGYDNITLGADEYYCLGDNRGASNDSRRLGPFSADQIKSKVLVKVYPFDEMRFLFVALPPFLS